MLRANAIALFLIAAVAGCSPAPPASEPLMQFLLEHRQPTVVVVQVVPMRCKTIMVSPRSSERRPFMAVVIDESGHPVCEEPDPYSAAGAQ